MTATMVGWKVLTRVANAIHRPDDREAEGEVIALLGGSARHAVVLVLVEGRVVARLASELVILLVAGK